MAFGIGLCGVPPASATVIFTSSFTSATTGHQINVEADMSISNGTLTIVLQNKSPDISSDPADTVSGFFFNIAGNPALTYTSAVGTVADVSVNPNTYTPNANLLAPTVSGGWMFSSGFSTTNSFKSYYGLGTAGFSSGPDSFNGNIVGGLNYSIYSSGTSGGNITNSNLTGKSPLVMNSATFTLTGLTGLTDANIGTDATFAFGTAPDASAASIGCSSNCGGSTSTPEPASLAILVPGLMAMAAGLRRRG